MQENTTISSDRIAYEHTDRTQNTNADIRQSAVGDVEDVLSIIQDIQESRTNKKGEIYKPLTRCQINTIQELNKEYLNPALAVLTALEESDE